MFLRGNAIPRGIGVLAAGVLLAVVTSSPLSAKNNAKAPGGFIACEAGEDLPGIAPPVPPLGKEYFRHDFESTVGITGANAVHLVGTSRAGTGFRPTGSVTSVPFGDAFDLSTNGGGFAFWIHNEAYYASDTGAQGVILNATDHPFNGFQIQFRIGFGAASSIRLLSLDIRDPARDAVARSLLYQPRDWTPGEWHHLAVTWGSGELRFYVDGRLRAIQGAPADYMTFPSGDPALPSRFFLLSTARLGSFLPASGEWTMDSLRTFNAALSHDEVIDLYRSELDRSGPTLKADRLWLKLLGPQDGYGLEGIVDTAAQRRVTMKAPSRHLWRLRFSSPTIEGKSFTIDNTAVSTPPTCMHNRKTGEVQLQWPAFLLPDSNFDVGTGVTGGNRVTVSLKPIVEKVLKAPEGSIAAQIAVEHAAETDGNSWTLDMAALRLGGIAPVDHPSDQEYLVLPQFNIGNYVPNPFHGVIDARSGGGRGWINPDSTPALYPSGTMAMQWLGLVDMGGQESGLYFAAHDPDMHVKGFFFGNGAGDHYASSAGALATRTVILQNFIESDPGIDVDLVSYPENIGTVGNSYEQSWPTVIGLEDGSWYHLAQRYRRFAKKQIWTQAGPMRDRDDYPEWMNDFGTMQPSTSYRITVKVLEDKIRALYGPDSSGYVYWFFNNWQQNSRGVGGNQLNDMPFFDLLAPQYLADEITAANAADAPVALYTIPTDWEITHDRGVSDVGTYDYTDWTWLDGESEALIKRFPTPIVHPTCLPSSHPDAARIRVFDGVFPYCPPVPDPDPTRVDYYLIQMEPTSLVWHDLFQLKIGEIIDELALEPGSPEFQGVYLDVLSILSPRLCYSENHRHRPGGGNYWATGYRELLSGLPGSPPQASQTGEPRVSYFSEGFSEPYIDLLDTNLIWNLDTFGGFNGAPLPLAMAVYHDYTQFVGRFVFFSVPLCRPRRRRVYQRHYPARCHCQDR